MLYLIKKSNLNKVQISQNNQSNKMERGQMLFDYQKHESHYYDISQYIIHEPKEDRRCTDVGCIVMFLLVLGSFFGIGLMEISEYNGMTKLNVEQQGTGQLYITQNLPIIAAGVATSILVAYLYVFLLKMFPRPMVHFMILLSMAVIAGLFFIGLVFGNFGLMVSMGLTFIIYSLLICCLRKKIDTGIALIKIATQFISEKTLVFTTPIVKLILTFLIGSFFAYSLSAIAAIMQKKNDNGQDSGKQAALIALWSLFWLIFTFVFYYMMTYVISFVCANWYYGIQGTKGSFVTAYKRMFTQFGSIVYAAMVVAVVTFGRIVIDQKRKQNKNLAIAVCLCIVSCLLKAVQDLLKVLNHYTVIMMSVTGQDYIDGARSTMGLLWKQLGLMSITNLICNFLVIWGLIISIGLPSILTYLLINSTSKLPEQKATVVALVAICSMLISLVIFEIIVQAVSCIFIYYSMDKDMVERGLINSYRMGQDNYNTINRYSTNPYLLEGQSSGNIDYRRIKP